MSDFTRFLTLAAGLFGAAGAAIGAGAACNATDAAREPQAHEPHEAIPEATTPTPDSEQEPTQSQQAVDSTAVVAYVEAQHYKFERILVARSNHFAVIVSRGFDQGAMLLLHDEGDSVSQLAEPTRLGRMGLAYLGPPAWGQWIGSLDQDPDTFIVSWYAPHDGEIGSTVMARHGGGFVSVFEDDIDACYPAEQKDVDGDGESEWVTYVDDLTPDDSPYEWACRDVVCRRDLQRFELVPAWVGIMRRVGDDWVNVESEYPKFYSELAERYDRAAEFAAGQPTGSLGCDPGTSDRLRRWASRARDRAGYP